MISIYIMEEKAEKPTEKRKQHRSARTNGTAQSAALGYGSATRQGIPDQRITTTLTMC